MAHPGTISRTVFLVAALSLSAGCLSLGLTSYSAEPIEATVVDAETGQPLEGVNVVAHWQLEGGMEGSSNVGQMMVMEAVTDANGVFRLPGWGPKRVPAGLLNARLTDKDPRMFIFKSGYQYREIINEKSMKETDGKGPRVRTSQWHGKRISLDKFEGAEMEYAWMLNGLGSEVAVVTTYGDANCYWTAIPKFTLAMKRDAELRGLDDLGVGTYYSGLIVNERFLSETGCGSVAQFIRSAQ